MKESFITIHSSHINYTNHCLDNLAGNYFENMINEKYPHSKLTSKIIGCAMEVHKALGNGFQEVVYQRALEHEFILQGVSYYREFEMPVFYKEKKVGTRRVDFLVGDIVSVELKAVTVLEDVHLAQAINYLEAYNLVVGLLINFGTKSLELRRLQNKKLCKQP